MLIIRLILFIRSYINKFYIVWNRIKFKLYGVKYGKNLKIYNKIYLQIEDRGNVEIGDNFVFTSGENINALARNIRGSIRLSQNASLKIGNNVGIGSSSLRVNKSITIGNNVKIGGDCIFLDSNSHSINYLERRNYITDSANKIDDPIVIEDDVFIGCRCIILKGVTIGARSIIGSGSVITKSIPADCIAAGNPAKVIKYLNKE